LQLISIERGSSGRPAVVHAVRAPQMTHSTFQAPISFAGHGSGAVQAAPTWALSALM
jgi:hypothetical protein